MAAVTCLVVGVGVAATLAFTAFRKNMMYFYTPTDLVAHNAPRSAVMDLGGLVKLGSVVREQGLNISFIVTDCSHQLPVVYNGVLPDLFRQGQGIVATGHLNADGTFVASRILAKHDSTYMPPSVARQVKEADPQGRRDCGNFKSVDDTVPRSAGAGVNRTASLISTNLRSGAASRPVDDNIKTAAASEAMK